MTDDLQKLQDRVRELELKSALTNQKLDAISKKLDDYGNGVARGLWLIGGGFIASFVAWVTQGGLSDK